MSLSNKLSSGQLQGNVFVIYTNKDRDRKKGRLAVLTELVYMYIECMTLEEVLLEARAKQRALEMAEELKKDEI